MCKIFFFLAPHAAPENTPYQHTLVSLAEGLVELGIDFESNINFWKQSLKPNDFLFQSKGRFSWEESDLVLFNSDYLNFGQSLPKSLFQYNRQYRVVLIDDSDGLITPGFFPELRDVDYVLKTHFNRKYTYPSNFYPWQFGLSNRIISYTNKSYNETLREDSLLVNFRVGHSVRSSALEKFIPIISDILHIDDFTNHFDKPSLCDLDELYWNQTGRRHYPDYYKKLLTVKAVACFGGYFQRQHERRNLLIDKFSRRVDKYLGLIKDDSVYQYDSWRLWETFAAGAAVFHVDFEEYGVSLPVIPEKNKHYFGVNFNNLLNSKRNLYNIKSSMNEVGLYGREWALKYYAPKPIAERLLQLLDYRI